MLSEMPPGLLDEWMAFDRLEYDTAAAIDRLTDVMQRGLRAVLHAAGCKQVPHDLLEPDPERQVGDMKDTMKPKHVAEKLSHFPQAW